MLQFVEALRGLYVSEEAEGQGLVEYALIIALISLLVIGLAALVAPGLTDVFTTIGDTLSGAGS